MAIDAKYERKHTDVLKDQRPKWEKYKDKARDPSNAVFFFVVAAVGTYIEPLITSFADLIFIIMAYYFYWLLEQPSNVPFKMPKSAGVKDPNNKKPDGSAGSAEGILYLGNSAKGEEVWFNNNDARTHILYLGTTGSGKTFGLKSIVCNALCWSSGFVYIDGKADTDLWSNLSALARRFGRDDDLLIMNYMTGNATGKVASNTLNPFSSGSASYLVNMLTSLMPDGGGDNAMWKERAVSLISAIMPCLVWKRDSQNIPLSIGVIRTYLTFPAIIKLSRDMQLPELLKKNVKAYLDELPGYVDDVFDDDGNEKPGNENADTSTPRQQHGFLSMQFTRSMSSLGEDYGFIFDTQAADVDMNDVVLNRRILVTLIPALEKSGDETANLGKIISSALKGMMGATLGNTVEGDTATAIENKPTTSSTPFIAVFDEVGYYAAQGMAGMAAQARSLGFCLIFAGQDMPALEKRVKEEARSITANCNIKIFGKLEDPTQTKEFFEKSVGQSMVTEIAGYEKGQESKNVTIQMRSRASYEELKYFGDGQAICTFGKNISEIKLFNHDIGHAKAMRVHRFLPIVPPSEDVLKGLHFSNTVTKRLRDPKWNPEKDNALHVDADIEALARGFTLGLNEKSSFLRAGALAVACVGDQHGLFSAARHIEEDDDEDDVKPTKIKKQPVKNKEEAASSLSVEDLLGTSSSAKSEAPKKAKKEKTEPITWAELIGADQGEDEDDDSDETSSDGLSISPSIDEDDGEEESQHNIKPITWADLIGASSDEDENEVEEEDVEEPSFVSLTPVEEDEHTEEPEATGFSFESLLQPQPELAVETPTAPMLQEVPELVMQSQPEPIQQVAQENFVEAPQPTALAFEPAMQPEQINQPSPEPVIEPQSTALAFEPQVEIPVQQPMTEMALEPQQSLEMPISTPEFVPTPQPVFEAVIEPQTAPVFESPTFEPQPVAQEAIEHPVSWQQLIGGATPDEVASMSFESAPIPQIPVEVAATAPVTTHEEPSAEENVKAISWLDMIGSSEDSSKTGN